jgi:NitT/TauT family transport system permease protein
MSTAAKLGPPPPVARAAAAAPSSGLSLSERLSWKRLGTGLQAFIVPVLALVAWEAFSRLEILPPGLLPSPSRVLSGWYSWAFGPSRGGFAPYSGTWAANALFSAERVLKGYALAILIGVPFGVLIGWSRTVARLFDPLTQSLRPIPITAWLPFSISLFGIGEFGSLFLIMLGAFYPIVVNATHGARDVNKNLVRAARMMGATPWQLLTRVVLPNALPAIFTGLRIGLGIAWTAVIVSEMVAVKSGLGYVLWDAYYIGRMDIVLADMISIGILGYLSDRLLLLLQSRLLHWKTLQQV